MSSNGNGRLAAVGARRWATRSMGAPTSYSFLEAAASGVPVVGLAEAGSWDALREGTLGRALALEDAEGLVQAIAAALGARKQAPAGVHVFSKDEFKKHLFNLMNGVGRS